MVIYNRSSDNWSFANWSLVQLVLYTTGLLTTGLIYNWFLDIWSYKQLLIRSRSPNIQNNWSFDNQKHNNWWSQPLDTRQPVLRKTGLETSRPKDQLSKIPIVKITSCLKDQFWTDQLSKRPVLKDLLPKRPVLKKTSFQKTSFQKTSWLKDQL